VLAVCKTCGFITNIAFDLQRDLYGPGYDNAQTHSAAFREYVSSTVATLIERYQLQEKTIIEVGCGQGNFLLQLCENNLNRGIGFDPSYTGPDANLDGRVQFIKDFYSSQYTRYHADLIVSRHVIEHIANPASFIHDLRQALGSNMAAAIFIETPDIRWILKQIAIWDIFYEHCSLFSPGSIARLLTQQGFHVQRITRAFGEQYMWVEAVPTDHPSSSTLDAESLSKLQEDIKYFTAAYAQQKESLRQKLLSFKQNGQRCVIWGAGAKGVALLNSLSLNIDIIPYVVDINHNKQNRYIPGTGQKIVNPEFLKIYKPDTVFIMNPNYHEEISQIINSLGLSTRIETI
jgi:2-polyprenyl-3-methyl-5-hydroxy-6-metoxy-1,4-benzoquinol methylase